MKRRSVLSTGAGCWIAAMLVSSSAHAYSEPGRFGEPIAEGGGGGRLFTGSPADGYTCDVCHSGPSPAEVRVQGLPVDGYAPGATYEIVIQWPQGVPSVSLMAEITFDSGQPAGTLALPPPDALLPAELCEPKAAGIPGALLIDTGSPRQVVGAADCGTQQVRMQWTAPQTAAGRVWFSGGLVQGDGEDDVKNDGVVLLTRPLSNAGGDVSLAQVEGATCHIGGILRDGPVAFVPAGLLAVGLLWMRRRYRMRRMMSKNSSGPT